MAKTDEFAGLAKEIAALVNTKGAKDVDEAMLIATDGGTLGEKLTEKVAKIGEKISFRRFSRFEVGKESGLIVPYIHMGGKIGVLVALEGAGPKNAEAAALAKDLAMQVAAANPTYVSRKDVPASVIEHEKSIYREQAKASGKPDKILDKIADGKLEKYYGDFCILEQAFIKDPDRKVGQLLAEAGKAAGAEITMKSFVRFQVGEGMEKRSTTWPPRWPSRSGRGDADDPARGGSVPKPAYRRILLKLSGEALMGRQAYGIDEDILAGLSQGDPRGDGAGRAGRPRRRRREHLPGDRHRPEPRASTARPPTTWGCWRRSSTASPSRKSSSRTGWTPGCSPPSRCRRSPSRTSGGARCATWRRGGW